MILEEGTFKYDKSLTGIVHYTIDKKLTEKGKYTFTINYPKSLLDYWRRELKNRYELTFINSSLLLSNDNSSISMNDTEKFEKFLISHMAEYFMEICEATEDNPNKNYTINKYYYSAKTLEGILNIDELQADLKLLADEERDFQIDKIKERITKAY